MFLHSHERFTRKHPVRSNWFIDSSLFIRYLGSIGRGMKSRKKKEFFTETRRTNWFRVLQEDIFVSNNNTVRSITTPHWQSIDVTTFHLARARNVSFRYWFIFMTF